MIGCNNRFEINYCNLNFDFAFKCLAGMCGTNN